MSLEQIVFAASELEPTKREIVSLVGRIYDPLGILSPIVIPLKIFTQELCVVKLDWDQPLTEQPLENWRQLSSSLREPSPIMIPRCFLDGSAAFWRVSLSRSSHIASVASVMPLSRLMQQWFTC